jgi:hypothetical protein
MNALASSLSKPQNVVTQQKLERMCDDALVLT